MATLEANLVKSVKSKLLSIVESEVQHALVENADGENALIIDAMALLQSMAQKVEPLLMECPVPKCGAIVFRVDKHLQSTSDVFHNPQGAMPSPV